MPDPHEPSDLEKRESEGYYLDWCRQWHRDPEDVGSMTAYEEEFDNDNEEQAWQD